LKWQNQVNFISLFRSEETRMKIYLIGGFFVILLLVSVESQNEVFKKTETIKTRRKYTPCIWKICSRPLKKNYEQKRQKKKEEDFIEAVKKILQSSKIQSIPEKYRKLIETLKIQPDGILHRVEYF
jgi:hypothetical protein